MVAGVKEIDHVIEEFSGESEEWHLLDGSSGGMEREGEEGGEEGGEEEAMSSLSPTLRNC